MTVWTREQLTQVRGLRGQGEVDVTQPQVDEAKAALHRKIARMLVDMAHPFAVEIDPRDVQCAQVDADDRRFTVTIRCWWEPQTHEAEFHGGPNDGTILEIAEVGRPIMLAEMPAIDWSRAETHPTENLTPFGRRYDCTGWDETHRRWVYTST